MTTRAGPQPTPLTAEPLEQFRRDGYVRVEQAFPRELAHGASCIHFQTRKRATGVWTTRQRTRRGWFSKADAATNVSQTRISLSTNAAGMT